MTAAQSPREAYKLALIKPAKRSKFGNVPTEVDGIRFASAREARRYSELKLLERGGEIHGLTLQPRFPLRVKDQKICDYIADFTYNRKTVDGQRVVEDAKGLRTPEYKIKAKLFAALYGYPVTEV